MAKVENLKPFTSEYQPTNRPSRKGIPNRATLFKKIGKVKVDADSLDGEKVTVTADEKAVIAAYKKAHEGDVKALALILDSLYGKIADKTEHSGEIGIRTFADLAKDAQAHLPESTVKAQLTNGNGHKKK